MEYVIIGGSAAGISAAEAIRGKDKKGNITLISQEEVPLYSRCLLPYYLAGSINEEKLRFKPTTFFKDNKIEAILGVKAEKVLSDKKKIILSNKKEIPYDKLLIATGSSSQMLDIPGADKKGVFGLRTIKDANEIKDLLKSVKTALILGGGLIGTRSVYALKPHGVKIKVIIKSNQVLSQMLDADSAEIIRNHLEKQGIEIITGLEAKEILGNGSVKGVVLDNGEKIDCQLIIIGKGVKPNLDLVRESKIKTDSGIISDDYLKTTNDDIYTAGDCAQVKDLITGQSVLSALWISAVLQGRIAGLNMVQEKQKYEGALSMNSVEFFGLPVISIGATRLKDSSLEELKIINKQQNIYKKIILKDNKIIGVILINKIDNAGIYNSLIRKKADISFIKNQLMDDTFDFAKIMPIVKDNQDKFYEEEYKELLIGGQF